MDNTNQTSQTKLRQKQKQAATDTKCLQWPILVWRENVLKNLCVQGTLIAKPMVTDRDMLRNNDRVAKASGGMAVRRGDYVSFLTSMAPDAVCSRYALNKTGAIANFVDPRIDVQRILDAVWGVDFKLLVFFDPEDWRDR